jgi:hypothetical protein
MKKLVSLLLSLILLVSLSVPAFADYANDPAQTKITSTGKDPGPMRPEETVWYYRTTDTGLFQKRLWVYYLWLLADRLDHHRLCLI